jgi:antitoxin (DNA-binding transcriptional repressor) of toxin-antitoxin stability system
MRPRQEGKFHHAFSAMKNFYSVKALQRQAPSAIRAAEAGALVTVTHNNRPVAHIVSTAWLGGVLQSIELLSDVNFTRQHALLRAGKLSFHPASTLAD